MKVALSVNGTAHEVDVPENTLLVDVIRVHLGLTGTHVGCDTTQCGACTVHMNGRAVKSCSILAVQAQGQDIESALDRLASSTADLRAARMKMLELQKQADEKGPGGCGEQRAKALRGPGRTGASLAHTPTGPLTRGCRGHS